MSLAIVEKIWDKWSNLYVGKGIADLPLEAALLINYDPTGPSRLLSTVVIQKGIRADPIEMTQFVNFVQRKKFQSESFFIDQNQYIVTSVHEGRFTARSLNASKPSGEGALVIQTAAFLLVGLYEGSIGPASRAMAAIDQFAGKLIRRNL